MIVVGEIESARGKIYIGYSLPLRIPTKFVLGSMVGGTPAGVTIRRASRAFLWALVRGAGFLCFVS